VQAIEKKDKEAEALRRMSSVYDATPAFGKANDTKDVRAMSMRICACLLYMCVYVCMYVCMYVWMCASGARACVCVWTRADQYDGAGTNVGRGPLLARTCMCVRVCVAGGG
jgi:hypothetical protein